MPSVALYADTTSGKLSLTNTGSYQTSVTFAYITSGSNATITGFTPKTYAGALEIPSALGGFTVTAIANYTFDSCSSLTAVTFASGSQLLTIGGSVFQVCTSLTSIIIPASVTSIGNYMFYNCSKLSSITFASGSQLLTIGTHAFQNCSSLSSIIIPASVTTIGEAAFSNCSGLTSITIPASVTSIGNAAFQGSGLSKMYVSTTNGLSLIPSVTPVTLYGKTFTIKDVAENPAIPICFPAGTKVTTDQGDIAIEKLNPSVNTIRGKKIVGITKTIPLQKHIISIEKDALAKNVPSVTTQISKEHKLFYKGKMVKARDLVEVCQGVTAIPYNGEILYNVLLKKHDKMMINNLICETLHPENIVAKIYNGNFHPTEKSKIYEKLNHIIRTNDVPEYNKLYASLK